MQRIRYKKDGIPIIGLPVYDEDPEERIAKAAIERGHAVEFRRRRIYPNGIAEEVSVRTIPSGFFRK